MIPHPKYWEYFWKHWLCRTFGHRERKCDGGEIVCIRCWLWEDEWETP